MTGDIYTVACRKGDERFAIVFSDENRAEALRTLGRWASDPGLSFTWYMAAQLSNEIRKLDKEECCGR